jgi:sulfide:quinone oxidoreductase
MATNVLVLGGGSGGLVAANKVKKLLGDRVEVTLVDKNGHHEFMPAYPWVPLHGAGGGPGEAGGDPGES